MATMPSEPLDMAHEVDALCRWGIRAAWHLSLLWGALVSLLSWTSGAVAATAVIRGLVTFVAVGLVGWGVNAVMVQAGHQAEGASTAEGGAEAPGRAAAGTAADEAAGSDGETESADRDGGADAAEESDASDELPEAA